MRATRWAGEGSDEAHRTCRARPCCHDLVASTLEYTLLVDVLAVHLTGRALVISPLTSAMLEVRRAVEFKPFSFSSVRGGRFRRYSWGSERNSTVRARQN